MTGPDRVTVLIDYQNVYGGARRQFHNLRADPATCRHIDPLRTGQLIVQRRTRPSMFAAGAGVPGPAQP